MHRMADKRELKLSLVQYQATGQIYSETIMKGGRYVNRGMDHIRANPGLCGRSVCKTLKKAGESESGLLKVEWNTEHTMLRIKGNNFGVLARIRGFPAKADELRERLRELVKLIETQIGCLSCELIENSCDSTEFTLLEEWSNEKAHDAHLRTDSIQSIMKTVRRLISNELDNSKHLLQANSVRYAANSYCLAIR